MIYVDETTFHSWQLRAKSWLSKAEPIVLARNNKRFGTTVYGAIGNCLKQSVFTLGKSTNAVEFREFLKEVKLALKDGYQRSKPFLVYDGATAHTAKLSQQLMEELFTPVALPTYSCEFNAIEKVWSAAKTRFRKKLLEEGVEIQFGRFQLLVLSSLRELGEDMIANLFKSNSQYVIS